MTEPQKEYIITEEQLLEIGGFVDYRDDSSYREMRELQNEIRSRPHSSAKESSDLLDELDTWIRSLKVQDEDIWLIERLLKKIAELRTKECE